MNDASDSSSTVQDSSGGAICAPGRMTCARGVVATCRADGKAWMYTACPKGQLCERDECVENRPTVLIVANAAAPDEGEPTAMILPALQEQASQSLCAATPECCEVFDRMLSSGTNEAAVVMAKYWIRKLATDLVGKASRLVLLGPPTAHASDAPPFECADSVARQVAACVGGDVPLMRLPDFQRAVTSLYDSDVLLSPARIPTWTELRRTAEGYDDLMRATLKEDTARDFAAVALWVDGRAEPAIDAQPANHELTLGPADGYPMALLAYLYLAEEVRIAGKRCQTDSDCGDGDYKCIGSGCVDGAAVCRTYDVIHVGPFVERTVPLWVPDICGGGPGNDVDYNVWTQWMRWGVSCSKRETCLSGAACRNLCDFTTFEPCEEANICVPDALVDVENVVAVRLLADFSDFFPSANTRDAGGTRFYADSHSILIGPNPEPNPYVLAFGSLDYATVAAVVGGGVAVTPCVPGLDLSEHPDWRQSGHFSCDYEERYSELVKSIEAHGAEMLCTPDRVGLPESAPQLLE